jgi:hypothetical protein
MSNVKSVTDTAKWDALMELWAALFVRSNSKTRAISGAIAGWISDTLKLHEKSHDRRAVRSWVGKCLGQVKGRSQGFIVGTAKSQGFVYDPSAIMDLTVEDSPELGQEWLQRLFKMLCSEFSNKLNSSAVKVLQNPVRKADKTPYPPCTVDMTDVNWSEEWFGRLTNVWNRTEPTISDKMETSDETLAKAYTF